MRNVVLEFGLGGFLQLEVRLVARVSPKLQWNDVVEEHRLGGVGREAGCAAELHLHIADESGVWAQVIVPVRSPAANADGRGNGLGRDSEVTAMHLAPVWTQGDFETAIEECGAK